MSCSSRTCNLFILNGSQSTQTLYYIILYYLIIYITLHYYGLQLALFIAIYIYGATPLHLWPMAK